MQLRVSQMCLPRTTASVSGAFAVEHDDTTSARTVELITRTGLFDDVTARADLAGRPRFVTATRQEGEPNS